MSDNNIEQVLKAVNIVDVISSYIPLKRAGSNYKARCPFHEEKTASFNVSETKQMFKCFGCGKGGNALTFVRDYEKITFFEALKKLAEKAGIQLQQDEYVSKKNTRRDLIYTIYELANDFYRSNFKKYGNAVKAFLDKRQIPLEVAEELSLGYALDSYTALKSYLTRNHINTDILSDTGLFRVNDKNDVYDIFRERLMFPIHNVSGKVVAFGGRALDSSQDKGAKYINSPTTDIYLKGNELYGLHLTRFEISKKQSACICEGYMDFLRLYQKGVKNAVASLGTALTKEQINLVSRYTKNFLLLYDGDAAGIKAAVKASLAVIAQGCQAKVILLPDKHDPDSYLLAHSTDDFQKLVDTAQSIIPFVKAHNKLFAGERQAIQTLLDVSPEIEDTIIRELYIKEIADTFGVSEINLRQSVKPQYSYQPQTITWYDQSGKADDTSHTPPKRHLSYKFEEERKLLKLLLKHPDMIKKVVESLPSDNFLNDNLRQIYEFLIGIENADTLATPAILIEKFREKFRESLTLSLPTIPDTAGAGFTPTQDEISSPIETDDLSDYYDELYTSPQPTQQQAPADTSVMLDDIETTSVRNIIDDLTLLYFDEDFMDSIDDLIRQVKLRKLEYDLKCLNDEIARDIENTALLEKKYHLKKEIVKLTKNVVRKTIV